MPCHHARRAPRNNNRGRPVFAGLLGCRGWWRCNHSRCQPEDPGRHVFLLLGCRPRLQANVIGRQRATQVASTAQPRMGIPTTTDSFLQWQCWLSSAGCAGRMHVTSDHGCHRPFFSSALDPLVSRLESSGALVVRHDPLSWMGRPAELVLLHGGRQMAPVSCFLLAPWTQIDQVTTVGRWSGR